MKEKMLGNAVINNWLCRKKWGGKKAINVINTGINNGKLSH